MKKSKQKILENENTLVSARESVLDKVVDDFYCFLLSLIPNDIAKKAAFNSKNIFKYYLRNKEKHETFLLVNRGKDNWQLVFKACPSYIDNEENFLKLEKHISANTLIFSIRDFYQDKIPKYLH